MTVRAHGFRHPHLPHRLLGAAALALTLGQAVTAAVASPALQEQTQPFDIPAQPLSAALIAFGQQAGVQVSVDSRLLADKHSGVVQGSLSLELALQRLLGGTGLVWQLSPNGTLRLEPEPSRAEAAGRPLQFDDVVVLAERQRRQGETLIDRRTIDALPAGNGDITSLLRIHPNVQFDDDQLSSKTPGEIDPADISINGAKYWQNLFLVDGMTMNNDIDPGQTANDYDEVPGRSQGLALDTDLLEEIRVLDSNVPAAYGGFNGGVVEAITRKPTKELHGKLSAQIARSAWTEYHINEQDPDLEEFEAAVGNDNQPEFDKLITRATLEGHLTDNFGLLANFSRKQSTIPTRSFGLTHSSDVASEEHDQKRRIDNYFIKAAWQINDDWSLDLGLTHAPETSSSYGPNAIDSYREVKQGGDSISARLIWNAPLAKLEQNLSWSSLENSRESESDYLRIWRRSTSKNWSSLATASEGGFGDIEQLQESFAYKLKADWHAFNALGLEHKFQSGFELSRSSSHYERLSDYYTNALNGTASTNWCASDDPWCALGSTMNGWPGQYIKAYTLTEAAKIEFDTTSWAVFLQDEIRYQRLTLRPGVRVDADDFMDKTTVAPRFALEYDVFGDNQTRFSAGANRYYGRNLATYRLRDGVAALQVNYSRLNQNAPWVEGKRAPNGAQFNQLDIPYDDEITLGLSHIQWDTEFAVKYVNRKGRDQISRAWGSQIDKPTDDPSTLASNYYTYYNGGKSDTDVYTFSITPLRNFALWGTSSSGQLALDWTKVDSSGLSDYTSSIGAIYVIDPIIQYDGSFIRYSDRPANNYNRPWTLRLTTATHIPQWNLTWSNFLRLRDGYRKIGATGKRVDYNGEQVRVWDEVAYGTAFTWDTRLAWELPTADQQALFVNLDVSNLLNRRITSNTSGLDNSIADDDVATYEIGRQFMVEVGYRF
ncbi:TonB-dependent receptor plug domain-containing protein [Stutzerimonas stutzeri]|uniref:TonB-dependent receptor plug domain-containing protein n=1 Tax=Stutzerimonas sp. S1 TaxID=3030652 RepID=UPI00222591F1|nr:TonB-dependent receptor plug domain-containing protein [Stutzerimonas sp. S1]